MKKITDDVGVDAGGIEDCEPDRSKAVLRTEYNDIEGRVQSGDT